MDTAVIAQIREEGLARSRVLETAIGLSDLQPPRLAGSPGYLEAARWAAAHIRLLGIPSAALEPWGTASPSWVLERYSVEMTAPFYQRVSAHPDAWSPSTRGTVTAPAVVAHIEADSDTVRLKGTLRGRIVLLGAVRPVPDLGRLTATYHLVLLVQVHTVRAQEMEPRAYSPSPVGTNFLAVGVGNSRGAVLFDPTVPITDARADLDSAIVGYARVFGLWGRQGLLAVSLPYVRGDVSGTVFEESRQVQRSGLADVRVKMSLNLVGCKAMTREDFVRAPPANDRGREPHRPGAHGPIRRDQADQLGHEPLVVQARGGGVGPRGPVVPANIAFASEFWSADSSGPRRVAVARTFEQVTRTGALGHPELATKEKGEQLFDTVTREVAAFLREFATWESFEAQ